MLLKSLAMSTEDSMYKCWHCQEKFITFQGIIEHCKADHANEQLKIRFRSMHPSTGKLVYVTQEFKMIPHNIQMMGQNITVHGDKIVLKDTPDLVNKDVDEPDYVRFGVANEQLTSYQ